MMIPSWTAPNPSGSLPSDVWLDIIHFIGDEDRSSLQSLSSVNTFIRHLTLPTLFHTIHLVVPFKSTEPKTVRIAQERLVQCIKGINVSPHISGHIRYLKLDYWKPFDESHIFSAYYRQLDIPDPMLKQTSAVYQSIIDLIPTLPRLYRLDLKECYLTQGFLDGISRSTSLESLRLNGFILIGRLGIPSTVHTLEYCPGMGPGSSSDTILASLLRQPSHFTALCLPLSDTPLLLTNPAGQFSRLQKLSLFSYSPLDEHKEETIYSLLGLAPDLRELHLTGRFYANAVDSTLLPNTIVPRLESLTATPVIANCIAPGRALRNIHILSFPQDAFLKSYNVVMKEVTNVSYDSMLADPKKEFSHLSSMFPNVSTLRITAVRRCETTHEEISDAILSVLPTFLRLRECGVFDTGRCPTDMNRDRVYCPIGRRDDPTYRCHPTIEDVQILSWYRWRWISKDGWRLVAVKYSAVDLWDSVFFDKSSKFLNSN